MILSRRAILAALAFGVVAPPTRAAAAVRAGDDVGNVARARGFAVALPAGKDVGRRLGAGSPVLFRDEIETGSDTRVQLHLIDGSRIMLGDGSRLMIDEMVYDPGTRGNGVIRLTEGVFRMISGQVNKVPGGTLTVVTPLVTIGVRGTDFWGLQTADKLTLALLDDGVVTVSTDAGGVILTEPGTAVTVEARNSPPAGPVTMTPAQLETAKATVAW